MIQSNTDRVTADLLALQKSMIAGGSNRNDVFLALVKDHEKAGAPLSTASFGAILRDVTTTELPTAAVGNSAGQEHATGQQGNRQFAGVQMPRDQRSTPTTDSPGHNQPGQPADESRSDIANDQEPLAKNLPGASGNVNQRTRTPGDPRMPGVSTSFNESQRVAPSSTTEQRPDPQNSPANKRTPAEIMVEGMLTGVPSAIAFDLSFADYFLHAAKAQHMKTEAADGNWQSSLFHLVRLVKAHPAAASWTAKQAIKQMETVMKSWRRSVTPQKRAEDDWTVWLGLGREDAHVEIIAVWDKVRYLAGHSPLESALEQARRQPLRPSDDEIERSSERYPLFVSLAGWLQVGMGNRNILLPVAEVAGLLEVEPMTVSRYRKWAIEHGYLKEVLPYKKPAGKQGKATEFRFDVSLFQVLREAAQQGTQEGFVRPSG